MLPSLRNWLESLPEIDRTQRPLPAGSPKRVMLIRNDSFGDQVIFGGFIAKLREAWPNTRLVLVTPTLRRHLYEHCPDLDEVFYFDWRETGASSPCRSKLFTRIRAEKPDYIINSVYTRDYISDRIVRYCHAPVRLGVTGPNPQMKESQRRKFDPFYTHLLKIPDFSPARTEIHILQQLLGKLGIPTTGYQPRIWTTAEDVAFAEKTFRESGFKPEETLVCFAGSTSKLRSYPQLNRLIGNLLRDAPWNVIMVGGKSDFALGDAPDEALRKRWLNLCGLCTIRESAELMRRCRLVLGVETGLAQVAIAVGARQVILQSGAYFGRFLSSSPLTSVAIQPVDCYFCHGECRWDEAYCLTHIPPDVFRRAIDEALREPADQCSIYFAEPPPPIGHEPVPHPDPHWEDSWADPAVSRVIRVKRCSTLHA